MSDKPWAITRRKLFWGAGILGLAGVTFGARLAFSREEDFVITMTRNALPGAVIAPGAIEQFAQDYVAELDADRHANLKRLVQLASLVSSDGVDWLLQNVEKYSNFRRTTVTQFLLRSSFFPTDEGKTEPVEYYGKGPFACANNPFAVFA